MSSVCPCLALLQGLADADDGDKARREDGLGLDVDARIGLAEGLQQVGRQSGSGTPKRPRVSEWPRMTYWTPTSASMGSEIWLV